ncbi:MAG: sulfatase-like hydrolase/transferase, partial [Ginsengibacter sp.]
IQGYEIINYSIFDLAGNPSLVSQNILPLKTKLITDRTLFGRMRKDLGWMLFTGKFKIKWLSDKLFYDNMRNNENILSKLEQSSLALAKTPRFFYGHLFMPHPPFYFDGKGNMQKSDIIYKVSKDINTEAYLEYVTYTNTRLKQLITAIKQNTKSRAVVIFMGDHGFRKATIDKNTSHFFENQNAVYFPGNDYRLFNDHITGVNQFRVIFNALFQQEFPLIKDSTFFLVDKK